MLGVFSNIIMDFFIYRACRQGRDQQDRKNGGARKAQNITRNDSIKLFDRYLLMICICASAQLWRDIF